MPSTESGLPGADARLTMDGPDVTVRAFSTRQDVDACVALQAEIWGVEFDDRVPGSLLHAATYVGGLALGAFAADGSMLGFVFSLTGTRDGEAVHWSHMLAVRQTAQGMGIGRRLKEVQKSELARRGFARVYWTFDPLQSRNAHLNLNRLGVRVIDYIANMYGVTGSPLHYGLATDRLIVTEPLGERAYESGDHRRLEIRGAEDAPIMTRFPRPGDTIADDRARPATVSIEIPYDLAAAATAAPQSLAAWRASTRAHFLWALRSGYTVAGLRRDPEHGRSFYLLSRPLGAPSDR